jgi:hypothetical protein
MGVGSEVCSFLREMGVLEKVRRERAAVRAGALAERKLRATTRAERRDMTRRWE